MKPRCKIASVPLNSKGVPNYYALTIEMDGYDCGSNSNLTVKSFWVHSTLSWINRRLGSILWNCRLISNVEKKDSTKMEKSVE